MNGTGHSILFQVALDRMTPQARAGITQLLTKNTKNPEEGGFETPSVDNFLPNQAQYPDQWKSYARKNHLPNDEGNLHFESIAIGPNAAGHSSNAGGPNGETHLEKQELIAADKSADPALRANATRWVVHEFGDVGAQPLHVIGFYSPEFPNGDQGGNKFNLNWQSEGKFDDNLHSLLDGGGAHPDPSDSTKSVDNYRWVHLPLSGDDQSFIQDKAKEIESKYNFSLNDPKVLDQNPADWSKDLAGQADHDVYPMFKPGENISPSDSRLVKMENIMDANVGLAGARLAAWANATFGGASAQAA